MPGSCKLAVSIPADLLASAERRCRRKGESRSALIRRALEALLAGERERYRVRRYVRGYLEQPETGDETAVAHAQAASVLSLEPWE
ncbi:MAG: ribbon-helix-helix protein, CopG family [Acidobacteriota bacterium]